MLPESELRIARAVELGSTTVNEIAKAWGVSDRTVIRIAKKHGVRMGGKRESENLRPGGQGRLN